MLKIVPLKELVQGIHNQLTLTPNLRVVEDLEDSSIELLEEQREGGGHLAVQCGSEVQLEVLHEAARHILLIPGTRPLTQHLTPVGEKRRVDGWKG